MKAYFRKKIFCRNPVTSYKKKKKNANISVSSVFQILSWQYNVLSKFLFLYNVCERRRRRKHGVREGRGEEVSEEEYYEKKEEEKNTKITGAHSACSWSTTQPRYRSEFVEFLSYFVLVQP